MQCGRKNLLCYLKICDMPVHESAHGAWGGAHVLAENAQVGGVLACEIFCVVVEAERFGAAGFQRAPTYSDGSIVPSR